MIVTATEFKTNLGKYLELAVTQDIFITFFAVSYQALRKSFQSSAKAKKRWNSFPSSLPLLMYKVWMFILLSCAPCQTSKMP